MRPIHLPHSVTLPLLASLGLSLFPWGKYVLYPFKLFTTWLHECCHAIAALLVGGDVSHITLHRDCSGLTHYRIPKGRLRHAFVASAGYPGACLGGCLLYWLCFSSQHHLVWLEVALGALMLLSGLIWVRGTFGFFAVLFLGASFLTLSWLGNPSYAQSLVVFLAIQTALGALLDIRELFSLRPGTASDARTLQSTLLLPAWFWSSLWLLSCVAMTLFTVMRA